MDANLSRKKKPIIILFIGLMVGGFLTWAGFKAFRPLAKSFCARLMEEGQDPSASRQNRVAVVEAQLVKVAPLAKRVASIGRLRANASVKIRSEMSGRIKELLFVEGTTVKANQPIIKFEDSDRVADFNQKKAQYEHAKIEFSRQQQLQNSNAGKRQEYDKAYSEVKVYEAAVEKAKAELEKAIIYAPFDGMIGLIDVSKGAYVQASQDLVTIVDTSLMKVDFKIPEKYIHEVGVGQTAEIRVDAIRNRVFKATVEAVDSAVEAESRSLAVRSNIPNEHGLLRPGLFADVQLIVAEKSDSMMVDESSVDREGEIEFVWVVERGKSARRRVLTGAREKGMVEITAGLQPGTIVVTAGQIKLQEGMRVKISNMPDHVTEGTSPQGGSAPAAPLAPAPAAGSGS